MLISWYPSAPMDKARVAVILAGCGHLDGAEISESVLSLLALRLEGFQPDIYALDKLQHHVINHLTQKESKEERNILQEAARIARGQIKPLQALNLEDYVALFLPGGFGVAKNHCDFAFSGERANVDPLMYKTISSFLDAQKPIAAICISPALVGLVAAQKKMSLRLTLGDAQNGASQAMLRLRHQMVTTEPGEVAIDQKHRVVTTGAYMFDTTLDKFWPGIQKCVSTIKGWVL